MSSSRLLKRSEQLVGEQLRSTARLNIEGFLPYYWIAAAFLLIVFRGGLVPAIVVFGVVLLIGRLLTRKRAQGFPLSTMLAVSDDQVYAISLSRRGDRILGAWPRAEVAGRLRRKRLTWAVTLDRNDLPPARLELLYYLFRKRPHAFLASITAPTSGPRTADA
jgi:hypothetical protein